MTRAQKVILFVGVGLCLLSIETLINGEPDNQMFLINYTASAPTGIYRRTSNTAPSVGDWVLAPGPAGSGFRRILKRVVAVAPSHVSVQQGAVAIDGQPIGEGNGEGGPIRVEMNRKLVGREAWLQNEHPMSFDSRYFGPAPLDELVRVVAVVTW